MTFRVGQKVVCIAIADKAHITYGEVVPEKGTVYTVRDVGLRDGPALRLMEIANPPQQYHEGFEECWFDQVGFRPVVERETDIGFAHEILRKASKAKETVASGRARDRARCPAVARFNDRRAA